MSFRLERGDPSVPDGIRRIALSQVRAARAALEEQPRDTARLVHDLRKCCKKVRGLIRLIRPAFPDHAAENRRFRDIGRMLAPLRDAEALRTVAERLDEGLSDEQAQGALALLREGLRAEQAGMEQAEVDALLAEVGAAFERAHTAITLWDIQGEGFAVVAGGLRKSYRDARRAMKAARKDPGPETLHAWRKRAKDHGYHLRLLRPVWPGPMKARRKAVDRLNDLLGDRHDLDMLGAALAAHPDRYGGSKALAQLAEHMTGERAAFDAEAFALGRKLFAEKPRHFVQRIESAWDQWWARRDTAISLLVD